MLPTTKYGLMGVVVGLVLGSVAAGGYYWVSSGKDTGSGSYTDVPATSYPVTGGAKTKHNRKHNKHNNKSKKHY